MKIKPFEFNFSTKTMEIVGLVDAADLSESDRNYLGAEDNELLELYGEVFVNRDGELDLICTQVSNGKKYVGVELDDVYMDRVMDKLANLPEDDSWKEDYYYDGNEQ
jgi:hypothetical protein